jgi:syntaxin 1B/2/3
MHTATLNTTKDSTLKLAREIVAQIKEAAADSDEDERTLFEDLCKRFRLEYASLQEHVQSVQQKDAALMDKKADWESKNFSGDADDIESGSMTQEEALILQSLQVHNSDVKQRHADILAIEQDMIGLAEIYKDIQHLVSEQQEDIDLVEANVESANTNAQQGLEHLKEAEKCLNKVQCCCFLLAA